MAKYSIGGQALIEGVMMRGPKKVALAVRNASKTIVTKEWEHHDDNKPKVFKVPFIRGIFNFIDSMKVGYKTLMISADIAMEYDEDDENNPDYKPKTDVVSDNKEVIKDSVEKGESTGIGENIEQNVDKKEKSKEDSGLLMNILMTLSSIVGVLLAVALFIWLPTFLFNLFKKAVPVMDTRYYQSIFEGVLKITIFIIYVSLVSLMEDMKRVFMYHGAEHKTIFCYENGLELTTKNVRKQTRFHPRCGTSFMALMLIISIFVGLFIPHNIPGLLRAGIKLLCIPIVMGIGYEAIKLAGRTDNLFVRIISAPGLWIQRITTKEPTDDMIECAIISFKAVLPEDNEDDNVTNEVVTSKKNVTDAK